MITTDEYGIYCQLQDDGTLDGGDSCARTGPLSLKYLSHKKNLKRFCVKVDDHYELVRHPFQNKRAKGMRYNFNDPRSTSGDNVIQWAVGVDKDSPQECKDTCFYYAENGWSNWDILGPASRRYLYEKSGRPKPKDISYFGIKIELIKWSERHLKLNVWWNTLKRNALEEINQFTCILIHFGLPYSFQFLMEHPDFEKNLIDYWDGWRNLPEVRECLQEGIAETCV